MSRRLVVSAFLLACPVTSEGFTYRVPQDHASIQAAIDLASPSAVDTILVGAGTYNERVTIRNKALVLRGQSADATTIHGEFKGNVLTVNGVGRNCIIEDLTITGGASSHPDSVGAAVYLNSYASPTIQRCRLVNNLARTGGGLSAYVFCEPLIRDCWISGNEGGAMVFELSNADMGTSWAEIENTVIVDNRGFGVSVLKGARAWLRNCTIAFNDADAVRTEQQGRVRIYNSIIANNDGGGVIRYDGTACFTLSCNDVFGNIQGNYLGANPSDPCFSGRGTGDVSVDPCFQDAANDNYHLQPTSPLCALRGGGACGVLGAYDDPCVGPPGTCVTAIEPATWGRMKTLYR